MSSNSQKYLSYKEAWRRINAAIEDGYFFEAVTLCESIIADRLLSYVTGVAKDSKVQIHSSFTQLIIEWRKLAGDSIAIDGTSNLGSEVDKWRKERNVIVHGFAKSAPGTPTDEVEKFLARAQKAATTGKQLARLVCKWHGKQLKAVEHIK